MSSETHAEIAAALALLAEGPRRIAAMTEPFDDSALQARPDEEAWSVNEILAHLRACGDVWGKNITTMLAQEHPTIRHLSPRTRMRKTDYHTWEFRPSLQAYVEQRQALLQTLRRLEAEEWLRGATFTGIRRGQEQTVLSHAQRIVNHEAPHLEQIEQVLHTVN